MQLYSKCKRNLQLGTYLWGILDRTTLVNHFSFDETKKEKKKKYNCRNINLSLAIGFSHFKLCGQCETKTDWITIEFFCRYDASIFYMKILGENSMFANSWVPQLICYRSVYFCKKILFIRCASISWFQIVSQWLIHLFQIFSKSSNDVIDVIDVRLAHLGVDFRVIFCIFPPSVN